MSVEIFLIKIFKEMANDMRSCDNIFITMHTSKPLQNKFSRF